MKRLFYFLKTSFPNIRNTLIYSAIIYLYCIINEYIIISSKDYYIERLIDKRTSFGYPKLDKKDLTEVRFSDGGYLKKHLDLTFESDNVVTEISAEVYLLGIGEMWTLVEEK